VPDGRVVASTISATAGNAKALVVDDDAARTPSGQTAAVSVRWRRWAFGSTISIESK
jgi:hypothetical protein